MQAFLLIKELLRKTLWMPKKGRRLKTLRLSRTLLAPTRSHAAPQLWGLPGSNL